MTDRAFECNHSLGNSTEDILDEDPSTITIVKLRKLKFGFQKDLNLLPWN